MDGSTKGAQHCVLLIERNRAIQTKPPLQDFEIMKNTSLFVAAVISLVVAGAAQAQPVMRDGAVTDASGRTA
jgi:hypothetical protein